MTALRVGRCEADGSTRAGPTHPLHRVDPSLTSGVCQHGAVCLCHRGGHVTLPLQHLVFVNIVNTHRAGTSVRKPGI